MTESNVPPNRKSQNKRSVFSKRSKSEESPKSGRSPAKPKRAAKTFNPPHSAQATSQPTNQRPASVPGWQVVEFPDVLSAEAQASSPRPQESESAPQPPQANIAASTPAASTPAAASTASSAAEQPSGPAALIALIQDANQRNHVLLNRISDLEEALEQSRQALQAEVDRTSDADESDLERDADSSSQQVSYLLNQLEFAHQTSRRQEILIETLRHQLQTSQDRVAQIERDYQRLQHQATNSTSELHAVRSQCRELQARLQRQQRYTLQFKAALEKCLEVPPPSYDISHRGSSAAPAPPVADGADRDPSDLSLELSSELSTETTSEPASEATIPSLPTAAIAPSPGSESMTPGSASDDEASQADALADARSEPRQDSTTRTEATAATSEAVGSTESESSQSAGSPATASAPPPFIHVPSLFPRSPQIQPWSVAAATAAESKESIPEPSPSDSSSLPSPLEALESSLDSTVAEPMAASPLNLAASPTSGTSGSILSKFHTTLRKLADIDLGQTEEALSSGAPEADSSNPDPATKPSAATFEPSGSAEAQPTTPAKNVAENVISLPEAFAVRQQARQQKAAPQPESVQPPASRRNILPPDLKKKKQAQGSRASEDAAVPFSSPDADRGATASRTEFPGSFSIVRPELQPQSDAADSVTAPPTDTAQDDTTAVFESAPDDTRQLDAKRPDVLWRELANLVDASTDDILKTHQAEVFNLLKTDLQQAPAEQTRDDADAAPPVARSPQHPDSAIGASPEAEPRAADHEDAEATGDAAASGDDTASQATPPQMPPSETTEAPNSPDPQSKPQSSIPPLTIAQPKSPKTDATLAALAQQSYQPDAVRDPWLDPTEAEDKGDRLETSTPNAVDDTASAAAAAAAVGMAPRKLEPPQAEQDIEASDASNSDDENMPPSEAPASSSAPSPSPAQREAMLPNLNAHRVDDWVNQSASEVEVDPESSPLQSQSETPSPAPQPAPSAPNWPAPLLNRKREKSDSDKSKTKSKTVDLPAFLR